MTLNGVHCLAIVAAICTVLIAAVTALSITGHAVPEILNIGLGTLFGALGGGGIVNRINAGQAATIAAVADAAVKATKAE